MFQIDLYLLVAIFCQLFSFCMVQMSTFLGDNLFYSPCNCQLKAGLAPQAKQAPSADRPGSKQSSLASSHTGSWHTSLVYRKKVHLLSEGPILKADQWWRIGYLRTYAGHNSEPNEHLENILPLLGPTLIQLGQHFGKHFFNFLPFNKSFYASLTKSNIINPIAVW